jgi:hypothetical protein
MSDHSNVEPLAVSPRGAALRLGIGITRVYALIGLGELVSYKDGAARKVTVKSIHERVERLIGAQGPDATSDPDAA